MDKKTAIAKFRKHWEWCSKNPLLKQDDYPEWGFFNIYNKCYLCEYFNKNYDEHINCKNTCIINWGESCLENKLYKRYGASSIKTRILPSGRAALARMISKLPER